MKITKAENLFLFLTLISVAYQNIIQVCENKSVQWQEGGNKKKELSQIQLKKRLMCETS